MCFILSCHPCVLCNPLEVWQMKLPAISMHQAMKIDDSPVSLHTQIVWSKMDGHELNLVRHPHKHVHGISCWCCC